MLTYPEDPTAPYYMSIMRKRWWFVLKRRNPGEDDEALVNPETGKMTYTEEQARAYLSTLLGYDPTLPPAS